MFSIKTSLIILSVVTVLAAGGGYKWRDYQASEEALDAANQKLADLKTELVDRDLLTAEEAEKSRTLEELLAALEESKAEVQIVREKEYVTKTIYSSCALPSSGVQLLNERITARSKAAANTGKR